MNAIGRHRPAARPVRIHRGFSLIEVMCALLIFAVGVLGIARLQSVAVQESSSAQFRATASLLAKNLIARMWLSDRTQATLQSSFLSAPAGVGYTAWLASVTASGLPGGKSPDVVIVPDGGGGATPVQGSKVTVIIYWKAPGDTDFHRYIETAQIK